MIRKVFAVLAPFAAVAAIALMPSAASAGLVHRCPTGYGGGFCIIICPPGSDDLNYCIIIRCSPRFLGRRRCVIYNPNPPKAEQRDFEPTYLALKP